MPFHIYDALAGLEQRQAAWICGKLGKLGLTRRRRGLGFCGVRRIHDLEPFDGAFQRTLD